MKCLICGNEIENYSNNASPLIDGVCCENCNLNAVLPYRLFLMSLEKEEQGILITVSNEIKLIKPKVDKFTLKELQEAVEGYIEVLPSPFPGYICIVDEVKGKLKDEILNDLANLILRQELVGNVLVIPSNLLD